MTTKIERQYKELLADEHRAYVRKRQADRKQLRRAKVVRGGPFDLVFIDSPRRRIRQYQAASNRRWHFEQEHGLSKVPSK